MDDRIIAGASENIVRKAQAKCEEADKFHLDKKSGTPRKISDTRRKHTSYVTLGKLCLHGRQNLIHGGKFLIHGGRLQVMLH